MANDYTEFEQRKRDHIALALMQNNQTTDLNILDKILLQHEALPDLNFDEIDIKAVRFGKVVTKPFLVSSMTAGHKDAQNINKHLMHAASANCWAMGVGSQRRELTDKKACAEWYILRKNYSDMCLFANLGIAQVITANNDDLKRLIDSLAANGLIVHCNPLQECIQPEGTTNFKGAWQSLENLVKNFSLPIIVKETGCGFSKFTMQRLFDIGVAAVDISGLGGTHWGRIETHRAEQHSIQQLAGITFKNWGLDTVSCLIAGKELTNKYEIWGSGGVRHGLDAAKLIALGASTIGFAKPLLQSALESAEKVIFEMQKIEYELKVAMFCTGSKFLSDLRAKLCL